MKPQIYAAPAVKGLNKLNNTSMSNFHSHEHDEVVGRGSGTQLQVGEITFFLI